MTTRSRCRFVGALLVTTLALAACSSDDGSSSDAASSPSESSATSGSSTATTDDVCAELSDVQTAAATVRSDVQGKEFAAVPTDMTSLESAMGDLVQAMSTSAHGDADEVESAWSNVKSTFESLDMSDLATARSDMQDSIGELKAVLGNVGGDLSCS